MCRCVRVRNEHGALRDGAPSLRMQANAVREVFADARVHVRNPPVLANDPVTRQHGTNVQDGSVPVASTGRGFATDIIKEQYACGS